MWNAFWPGRLWGARWRTFCTAACAPAAAPFTFPKELCNTPAYLNYPGYGGKVKYQEEVFVGYRYYDTKGVEPLFCFGHGLSYARFAYKELALSAGEITDADTLTVQLTVENTSGRAGAETVQLYVAPPPGQVLRPVQELRGVRKGVFAAGREQAACVSAGKAGVQLL